MDNHEAVPPEAKFRLLDVLLDSGHPGRTHANADELSRLTRVYETILSTTDDFAYIFDPEGRFLYANARLLEVWSKTLDQVIGKTCYDLGYPTWHADMHMREIAQVVRDKIQIRGEVPFTGASGISGVYDYIFKPVFDEAGNVEVIVGTTRDVTDRKKDEEKLKAAQIELQKYAEQLEARVAERTASLKETIGVLESFSYSIVHDMRAPLRSMQSYASLLASDHLGELGPDARLYLERITKSAIRMDRLIQDVLSFSRLSREEIKLQPVDADALLRDVLDTYPDLHAHKDEIEVLGPLPSVLANEAALTQCFSNLLGNAFKFRGREKPRVRIWSEPHEANIRFYFEDNGIGIPEHLHERIFELFERATPAHDGTGIGLSIVRTSVGRMGGRVGVISVPDQGSRFWIELRPA